MPLTLEIVTPDRKVFSGTADCVVLPTAEGEIGVLPGHLPLIAQVEPGEVALRNPGPNRAQTTGPDDVSSEQRGPKSVAVDRGFLRVLGDTVSILTEAAIDVQQINLEEVAQAEERARAALEEAKKQPQMDVDEIERLERMARFAITQQSVKRRRG
ncbi:MAG: ATP synthase F1 subunit epsilon [Opitutales bacterium]